MGHREIKTIGDAKRIPDLFTLLFDFEAGFRSSMPGADARSR